MKNRTGSLIILLTTILVLTLPATAVSAVTYQTGIGVSFTFNPTLTLSLSSSNLEISNLAPGTKDDSNEITITVSTNAAYGYNLSATVGNSTTYNNRNLTHTNGNNTFSSIAYQSNPSNYITSANFNTDNTWGYSIDSGTKYNGLPLYSDTTNIATLKSTDTTPSTGTDTVNFLIGAKASVTQPAGEYKNVINFMAVTNPVPLTLEASYAAAGKTKYNGYYKLQDMNTAICDNAEVLDEGSQMQAIDTRDNKVYWITKLQDGHCWMTQNLDLDLETTPTNVSALNSTNTDLNEYGTAAYGSANGYSCSNNAYDCTGGVITWTPANVTDNVNNDGTFAFARSITAPVSLNVYDWYYAGYDGTTLLTSTTVNYLTSDNRTKNGDVVTVNDGNGVDYFSTAPFATNGTHGHVGNYYNWTATVASNDTSSFQDSTYANPDNNPQNSICPAGWRLPTITSASPTYTNEGSRNEFARIAKLYANYAGSTSISSAGLEASPLFFARSGYVNGASLHYSGYNAYYWSSSVYSSSLALYLTFYATSVAPQTNSLRDGGRSVRCLAR